MGGKQVLSQTIVYAMRRPSVVFLSHTREVLINTGRASTRQADSPCCFSTVMPCCWLVMVQFRIRRSMLFQNSSPHIIYISTHNKTNPTKDKRLHQQDLSITPNPSCLLPSPHSISSKEGSSSQSHEAKNYANTHTHTHEGTVQHIQLGVSLVV